MTDSQKTEIVRMRNKGVSFSKISEITGISRNTIKSFCRRKNIEIQELPHEDKAAIKVPQCKQCGELLQAVPSRKPRKFCSKECRTQWWNTHPEEVHRKAVYNFICAGCGRAFTAYGNKGRRFCSHSCYINARFGCSGDNE